MTPATTALTVGFALVGSLAHAQSAGDWRRVESLPPGKVVVVTSDSGALIRGRILRADADLILLYAPTVDTRQFKPLDRLARDRAHLLERVDRVLLEMPESGIQVNADGIFKKKVRIAAFGEVFHIAPRASVVSVIEPKEERASGWPAMIGGAIGGVAGFYGGLLIAFRSETYQTAAVPIGGSVLGAVVGYRLGQPAADSVIYIR